MARKRGSMQGAHQSYRIVLELTPQALAYVKFTGEVVVAVDTGKEGLKGRLRLSDDQLIGALKDGKMSLRDVSIMTGWSHEAIRQRAIKLGLDTSTIKPKEKPVEEPVEDDEDTPLDELLTDPAWRAWFALNKPDVLSTWDREHNYEPR